MSKQEGLKVEVPSRVAFVNLKDGSVFFDCHPAEARVAMDAVKANRAGAESATEEKEAMAVRKQSDEIVAIANTKQPKTIDMVGAMSAQFVSDRFRDIEDHNTRVTHIILNAHEYADLRSYDRDTIDMETRIAWLRQGIMATMWGAHVIVRSDCPVGQPIFASYGEGTDEVQVVQLNRKPAVVDFAVVIAEIDRLRQSLMRLSETVKA